MNTTKIWIGLFVAAIFLCVLAAPVKADWDEGGSYKMHFPQLPDPNGWDVANYNTTSGEPLLLADDWLCTETGLVTDIHIWGSWLRDLKGEIESFNVSIWSNDLGTNFSHPDVPLWQHTFSKSEFTERYWGNGSQGWDEFYSDSTGRITMGWVNDHNDMWQYNLHINPTLAFKQEEGTTYWLALSPQVNNSDYKFGWKTSEAKWQDDFVVETLNPDPEKEGKWLPSHVATEPIELSLAFVIAGPPLAPEVPILTPIGLITLVSLLSAIAAVAIVRKRR